MARDDGTAFYRMRLFSPGAKRRGHARLGADLMAPSLNVTESVQGASTLRPILPQLSVPAGAPKVPMPGMTTAKLAPQPAAQPAAPAPTQPAQEWANFLPQPDYGPEHYAQSQEWANFLLQPDYGPEHYAQWRSDAVMVTRKEHEYVTEGAPRSAAFDFSAGHAIAAPLDYSIPEDDAEIEVAAAPTNYGKIALILILGIVGYKAIFGR